MKMLLYSHFFAPSMGGVETIVLSLARGLAELRVAAGTPEFDLTIVTETPAEDYDDGALPFPVVRQASLLQLWRLIRTSDVIHLAGPAFAPLLLAQLARKRVVVEHHGFQTICPNGQLLIEPAATPCPGHFMAGRHAKCLGCNSGQGWLVSGKLWLLTFVRRFLCARVAANITPTQWLGGLVQLPHIVAIPHGLEATAVASQRTPSPAQPLIAFQGRLVTTKGVRLLLEAARILQEQNHSFALLIIGDGPERDTLEKFVKLAGLVAPVRFIGRVAASQLEAALAKASVVVVPSLGGEVFGLVLAENMQRAIPIVASDLGAFAEVLGDAGLLFRTGDAMDLAAKLALLLDDSALLATSGRRAQQRVAESYSLGVMTEAHARVYRKVAHCETT